MILKNHWVRSRRSTIVPQRSHAPGDHLLVRQHRLVVGAPVDGRVLPVGQPSLEEPQEQPLGPPVVLGVARPQQPGPVERHAHPLEGRRLLVDVRVRPFLGVDLALDRRVLGVQPERVPSDRVQDVVTLQRSETRDGVAAAERLGVAHVQVARGIREHVERVEPRPRVVGVVGGPIEPSSSHTRCHLGSISEASYLRHGPCMVANARRAPGGRRVGPPSVSRMAAGSARTPSVSIAVISAARTGRENRKPCPIGQSSARRNASSSLVSTPSASGVIPRFFASWTIAWTMPPASRSRWASLTNDRSIFRMSMGRCLRRPSDEYPVPKSSIAIWNPSSCRALQDLARALRVRHGGRFGDLDHDPMRVHAGRLQRVQDLLGEPGRPQLPGRHVDGDLELESGFLPLLIWPHISPITQLPMASIRPISSASGMKSPGGSARPVGHASDERLDAQEMAVDAGRRSADSATPNSLARRPGGVAWRVGAGASGSRGRSNTPRPTGTAAFRSIHRHVGMTQQRLAVDRVAREHADAERSADGEVDPVEGERLLKSSCTRARVSSTRASAASLAIGDRGPADQIGRQEEELVAALARNQVGFGSSCLTGRRAG